MIISNNLQAHYIAKKINKQYEIGKKENLIPVYLNNGIEIFSHQIYAACYALSNPFVKGFILADEAGLGKTLEALLIVSQYSQRNKKILIIVPSPTVNDWLQDLIRKFEIRAYILDNTERPINEMYRTKLDNFEYGVVLTTYDYVLSNSEKFKEYSWDLCVLDEAHRFRSYKIKENKTAETILSIIPNAKKILLTATPIQKNEDDVFGLINFIDDSIFTDYDEFHKKYFRKPENYPELREIIAPYTFRTLRSQVRLETKLTEREILTQIYKMTDEEQKLYKMIENYISKPSRFAFPEMDPYELSLMLYGTLSSSAYALSKTLSGIYARLNKKVSQENQQEIVEIRDMLDIASRIKINNKDKMLLKALEKTFSSFHKKGLPKKCVIFTGNTQSQEHIHKLLMEYTDYLICSFNGTTDDEPIQKFLKSDRPSILISTDKGNESLNWQNACFIINYDFPQVLLDMEQRISRCHRIGQASDVFVINFICPDNFSDVRMYELFYKRVNISNSIVGASDTIISGAVDGNIEQNIVDILSGVRKKKEVQMDFTDLGEQFKKELEDIRNDANTMLFNTFNKNLIERTKNMAEIIRKQVSDLKSTINDLAHYYFKDKFITDTEFEVKTKWHDKNPYAKPFVYTLTDNKDYYQYTLNSEPCKDMIFNLTSFIDLKPTHYIMESSEHKGLKGYIAHFNIQISMQFNLFDESLLLGIDENGNLLDSEICEQILMMKGTPQNEEPLDEQVVNKLNELSDEKIPEIVESLKIKYSEDLKLPISHLNMIANDKKAKLEKEIKGLQKEIDNLKDNSYGDNFGDKFAKNQQINELTEKLFELKDNEFLEKSKINRELKAKSEELSKNLEVKIHKSKDFMIYFEVR